jgi:hypothetical protein
MGLFFQLSHALIGFVFSRFVIPGERNNGFDFFNRGDGMAYGLRGHKKQFPYLRSRCSNVELIAHTILKSMIGKAESQTGKEIFVACALRSC